MCIIIPLPWAVGLNLRLEDIANPLRGIVSRILELAQCSILMSVHCGGSFLEKSRFLSSTLEVVATFLNVVPQSWHLQSNISQGVRLCVSRDTWVEYSRKWSQSGLSVELVENSLRIEGFGSLEKGKRCVLSFGFTSVLNQKENMRMHVQIGGKSTEYKEDHGECQ